MEDSTVTENSTYGTNAHGGGIHSKGGLATILRSTITDNIAGGSGGGINAEVYLADSTVSENTASRGGGLRGIGTIARTTISNNEAVSGAGVIVGVPEMLIVDSTLAGNEASASGGALFVDWENRAELINTTISGNSAGLSGSGSGSAIFVEVYGSAVLRNSTVARNDVGVAFSAYYHPDEQVYLYNSIVANDFNCWDLPTSSFVNDEGGNLTDKEILSCEIENIVTGLDPVLRDNGGPTETHALLPGSLATDFSGPCPAATDQRGVPRTDGMCDTGAYEFTGLAEIELEVSGTCPEAVTLSMVGATGSGRVLLASSPTLGDSEVPQGVCEGTPLDLGEPTLRAADTVALDGSRTYTHAVREGACGTFVQVIDVATCAVSPFVVLP